MYCFLGYKCVGDTPVVGGRQEAQTCHAVSGVHFLKKRIPPWWGSGATPAELHKEFTLPSIHVVKYRLLSLLYNMNKGTSKLSSMKRK